MRRATGVATASVRGPKCLASHPGRVESNCGIGMKEKSKEELDRKYIQLDYLGLRQLKETFDAENLNSGSRTLVL